MYIPEEKMKEFIEFLFNNNLFEGEEEQQHLFLTDEWDRLGDMIKNREFDRIPAYKYLERKFCEELDKKTSFTRNAEEIRICGNGKDQFIINETVEEKGYIIYHGPAIDRKGYCFNIDFFEKSFSGRTVCITINDFVFKNSGKIKQMVEDVNR